MYSLFDLTFPNYSLWIIDYQEQTQSQIQKAFPSWSALHCKAVMNVVCFLAKADVFVDQATCLGAVHSEGSVVVTLNWIGLPRIACRFLFQGLLVYCKCLNCDLACFGLTPYDFRHSVEGTRHGICQLSAGIASVLRAVSGSSCSFPRLEKA